MEPISLMQECAATREKGVLAYYCVPPLIRDMNPACNHDQIVGFNVLACTRNQLISKLMGLCRQTMVFPDRT